MKQTTTKIVLTSLLLGAGLSAMSFSPDDKRAFKTIKGMETFHAVFKDLEMLYVDTFDIDKAIQNSIDGLLKNTDPYTEYYSETTANELKELTTGKYAGIGASIRVFEGKDRVTIVEPMEGKPAFKAGVKPGDIILSIGGKEMKRGTMSPSEFSTYVSSQLRGEAGTSFILKVLRPMLKDSVVKEIKITRENIRQNPIPYATLLSGDMAYIALSDFTENCAKDFKKNFIELKQQGAKKLIIDLRNNGGGLLNEAVEIANLFIPKGQEVVLMKGKQAGATYSYKTTQEPIDLHTPIVVLVNGGSASASEIVSGAFQDLDRAVVVGERTYGKGLVQTTRPMPYNATFKLTTAKYYIPSGRCIQAIDYAQLNAGNSGAIRTPDSLTKVFHTVAGREVRDGGGIRPDVEVKAERVPNIVLYLYASDLVFNYANRYVLTHPVPASVKNVQLTDADYTEFKNMVKKSNFTYDRQSEHSLKKLKEIAELEGYANDAKEEFAALERKLTHNLDKELDYFSKQIRDMLVEELTARYFYRRGVAEATITNSEELKKAQEILLNEAEYRRLLSSPVASVEKKK